MPHLITSAEIHQVENTLGFIIQNNTTQSAGDFINAAFPNLDLYTFIDSILSVIAPMTNALLFKRLTINSIAPVSLIISCFSEDYQDKDNGMVFQRTFIKNGDDLKVNHDYLVFPENFRKKGHSRKVLAICLQQYLKSGR